MLEITSDKNIVTFKVFCGWPISNWTYKTTFTCNDEAYATLLAFNMREHMQQSLQNIRQESYDKGWKEAKAKNKKSTWFSRMWKTT